MGYLYIAEKHIQTTMRDDLLSALLKPSLCQGKETKKNYNPKDTGEKKIDKNNKSRMEIELYREKE